MNCLSKPVNAVNILYNLYECNFYESQAPIFSNYYVNHRNSIYPLQGTTMIGIGLMKQQHKEA